MDTLTYRLQLDSQGNVLALGGDLNKRTPQGDSIWSRSYQQFGILLDANRLVELPNNRYLVGGTLRPPGATREVGLVVVDGNGTRLRDTVLVRVGDENMVGLALTPANHYVVAIGSSRGPIGGADQLLFAYRNWDRLLPARSARPPATAALTAYPNPTADALTLEAPDGHPLAGQWTLFDGLGRAVQTGALPRQAHARLSLAGRPSGLYLLQVRDEQARTTQTIRIEKR